MKKGPLFWWSMSKKEIIKTLHIHCTCTAPCSCAVNSLYYCTYTTVSLFLWGTCGKRPGGHHRNFSCTTRSTALRSVPWHKSKRRHVSRNLLYEDCICKHLRKMSRGKNTYRENKRHPQKSRLTRHKKNGNTSRLVGQFHPIIKNPHFPVRPKHDSQLPAHTRHPWWR